METTDLIDIAETERAVFVGQTGSGKTTLSESLLKMYPYVISIDEKAEYPEKFYLPNATVVRSPAEVVEVGNYLSEQPFRPMIYQPEPEYWNMESYDAVFHYVYRRRNTRVHVAEIYAVMRGTTFPPWYQAILTRGRSLRISCISETQRPSRIPVSVLSEAQHYCIFPLHMPEDRERMAGIVGKEVLKGNSNPFSFWYYKVGGGPPKEYIMEERSVSRILSRRANPEYAV